MSLIMNLYYKGKNKSAQAFAKEMEESGTVKAIREEDGNEGYSYYISIDDPETVLLVDKWRDQESLDRHHSSEMMKRIAELREKYDLHMTAERLISLEISEEEKKHLRS